MGAVEQTGRRTEVNRNRMGEQQSARVNVDDSTWLAFRILAMRRQRSIADYLGELVEVELAERDRRRNRPALRPPTAGRPDVGVSDDVLEQERPSRRPAKSEPVRLSETELLTGLPGAAPESPAWEP